MAFGVQIDGSEVDIQPQTTRVVEGAGNGVVSGYVISETEDRSISLVNIPTFDLGEAIVDIGVVIFNDNRTVISSSVFNFVNLLSLVEVNLVDVYNSGPIEYPIPAHSYKPVVAFSDELQGFQYFATNSVVTATSSTLKINNNVSGGTVSFAVSNSTPFSDDKFTVSYTGDVADEALKAITAIGSTIMLVGELPNDITTYNP